MLNFSKRISSYPYVWIYIVTLCAQVKKWATTTADRYFNTAIYAIHYLKHPLSYHWMKIITYCTYSFMMKIASLVATFKTFKTCILFISLTLYEFWFVCDPWNLRFSGHSRRLHDLIVKCLHSQKFRNPIPARICQ